MSDPIGKIKAALAASGKDVSEDRIKEKLADPQFREKYFQQKGDKLGYKDYSQFEADLAPHVKSINAFDSPIPKDRPEAEDIPAPVLNKGEYQFKEEQKKRAKKTADSTLDRAVGSVLFGDVPEKPIEFYEETYPEVSQNVRNLNQQIQELRGYKEKLVAPLEQGQQIDQQELQVVDADIAKMVDQVSRYKAENKDKLPIEHLTPRELLNKTESNYKGQIEEQWKMAEQIEALQRGEAIPGRDEKGNFTLAVTGQKEAMKANPEGFRFMAETTTNGLYLNELGRAQSKLQANIADKYGYDIWDTLDKANEDPSTLNEKERYALTQLSQDPMYQRLADIGQTANKWAERTTKIIDKYPSIKEKQKYGEKVQRALDAVVADNPVIGSAGDFTKRLAKGVVLNSYKALTSNQFTESEEFLSSTLGVPTDGPFWATSTKYQKPFRTKVASFSDTEGRELDAHYNTEGQFVGTYDKKTGLLVSKIDPKLYNDKLETTTNFASGAAMGTEVMGDLAVTVALTQGITSIGKLFMATETAANAAQVAKFARFVGTPIASQMQYHQRWIQQGLQEGMTLDEATTYSMGVSGMIALLQPLYAAEARMGERFFGGMTKGMTPQLVRKTITNPSTFLKKVGTVLKETVGETGEELLENALEKYVANRVTNNAYGTNLQTKYKDWDALREDIYETAFVTAFATGPLSAVTQLGDHTIKSNQLRSYLLTAVGDINKYKTLIGELRSQGKLDNSKDYYEDILETIANKHADIFASTDYTEEAKKDIIINEMLSSQYAMEAAAAQDPESAVAKKVTEKYNEAQDNIASVIESKKGIAEKGYKASAKIAKDEQERVWQLQEEKAATAEKAAKADAKEKAESNRKATVGLSVAEKIRRNVEGTSAPTPKATPDEDGNFEVPTSSKETPGTTKIDKKTFKKWKAADDKEKADAQAIRDNVSLNSDEKQKRLMGNAMHYAAEKRQILGTQTAKEKAKSESTIAKGEQVEVEGTTYSVVDPSVYGKVRIRNEDTGEETLVTRDSAVPQAILEGKKTKPEVKSEAPSPAPTAAPPKAAPTVEFTGQSVSTPNKLSPLRKRAYNASRFLSKLGMPIKVVVHASEESFFKATGTTNASGVYLNGEIHLNEAAAVNQDELNTRGIHEAWHPVLEHIKVANPDLYKQMTAFMYKEAAKNPYLKKKIDKFVAKYQQANAAAEARGEELPFSKDDLEEEALTEFLTEVSENPNSLTLNGKRSLAKAILETFKKFSAYFIGVDKRNINDLKGQELVDIIQAASLAFSGDLSQVDTLEALITKAKLSDFTKRPADILKLRNWANIPVVEGMNPDELFGEGNWQESTINGQPSYVVTNIGIDAATNIAKDSGVDVITPDGTITQGKLIPFSGTPIINKETGLPTIKIGETSISLTPANAGFKKKMSLSGSPISRTGDPTYFGDAEVTVVKEVSVDKLWEEASKNKRVLIFDFSFATKPLFTLNSLVDKIADNIGLANLKRSLLERIANENVPSLAKANRKDFEGYYDHMYEKMRPFFSGKTKIVNLGGMKAGFGLAYGENIYLNEAFGKPTKQVIIHEMTHGITGRGMMYGDELYDEEFHDQIIGIYDKALSIEGIKGYGMSNEFELVAEALSNPLFAEQLAKVKTGKKGQSLFTDLLDSVAKFFQKVLGIDIAASLLDEVHIAVSNHLDKMGDRYKSIGKQAEGSKAKYSLIGDTTVKESEYSVEVVNGFYSPLEKTIAEAKSDKLPVKQWLDKFAKGEEAVWTGLIDWLNTKTESVSKGEILDYLRNNRVEISEVVKDLSEGKTISSEEENKLTDLLLDHDYLGLSSVFEAKEAIVGDENWVDTFNVKDKKLIRLGNKYRGTVVAGNTGVPKYEKYQLPGEKSNYKEILVTLPQAKSSTDFKDVAKDLGIDVSPTEGQTWSDAFRKLPLEERQRVVEESNRRNDEREQFRSSHWNEPNILVHLRTNVRTDADGRKTLLIEEIQSDWGQRGKKEGFGESERLKKARITLSESKRLLAKAKEKLSNVKESDSEYDKNYAKDSAKRWEDIVKQNEEQVAFVVNTNRDNIPTAPFVTNTSSWTKLGLKVALKEAVAQGAETLSWTTGEQQAERYDISKQVDYISINHAPENVLPNTAYVDISTPTGLATLQVDRTNGNIKDEKGNLNMSSEGKNLEDVVGKDVAQKVLESKDGTKLEGDGLKVGGKGMIGFYGSPTKGELGIVGNVAKKLFGQEPILTQLRGSGKVQIEGVEIFNAEGNKEYDKYRETTAQHSVYITEEIAETVRTGQAKFSLIAPHEKEIASHVVELSQITSQEEKDAFVDDMADLFKVEPLEILSTLANQGLVWMYKGKRLKGTMNRGQLLNIPITVESFYTTSNTVEEGERMYQYADTVLTWGSPDAVDQLFKEVDEYDREPTTRSRAIFLLEGMLKVADLQGDTALQKRVMEKLSTLSTAGGQALNAMRAVHQHNILPSLSGIISDTTIQAAIARGVPQSFIDMMSRTWKTDTAYTAEEVQSAQAAAVSAFEQRNKPESTTLLNKAASAIRSIFSGILGKASLLDTIVNGNGVQAVGDMMVKMVDDGNTGAQAVYATLRALQKVNEEAAASPRGAIFLDNEQILDFFRQAISSYAKGGKTRIGAYLNMSSPYKVDMSKLGQLLNYEVTAEKVLKELVNYVYSTNNAGGKRLSEMILGSPYFANYTEADARAIENVVASDMKKKYGERVKNDIARMIQEQVDKEYFGTEKINFQKQARSALDKITDAQAYGLLADDTMKSYVAALYLGDGDLIATIDRILELAAARAKTSSTVAHRKIDKEASWLAFKANPSAVGKFFVNLFAYTINGLLSGVTTLYAATGASLLVTMPRIMARSTYMLGRSAIGALKGEEFISPFAFVADFLKSGQAKEMFKAIIPNTLRNDSRADHKQVFFGDTATDTIGAVRVQSGVDRALTNGIDDFYKAFNKAIQTPSFTTVGKAAASFLGTAMTFPLRVTSIIRVYEQAVATMAIPYLAYTEAITHGRTRGLTGEALIEYARKKTGFGNITAAHNAAGRQMVLMAAQPEFAHMFQTENGNIKMKDGLPVPKLRYKDLYGSLVQDKMLEQADNDFTALGEYIYKDMQMMGQPEGSKPATAFLNASKVLKPAILQSPSQTTTGKTWGAAALNAFGVALFPFARMIAQTMTVIYQYHVIGGIVAAGKHMAGNKSIYVGSKVAKTVPSQFLKPSKTGDPTYRLKSNAELWEQYIMVAGSAVAAFAYLFMSMFDWDDDEITLKEDRLWDVTFRLTGNNYENSLKDPGTPAVSWRTRDTPEDEWGEWKPWKYAMASIPMLAPIGYIRDAAVYGEGPVSSTDALMGMLVAPVGSMLEQTFAMTINTMNKAANEMTYKKKDEDELTSSVVAIWKTAILDILLRSQRTVLSGGNFSRDIYNDAFKATDPDGGYISSKADNLPDEVAMALFKDSPVFEKLFIGEKMKIYDSFGNMIPREFKVKELAEMAAVGIIGSAPMPGLSTPFALSQFENIDLTPKDDAYMALPEIKLIKKYPRVEAPGKYKIPQDLQLPDGTYVRNFTETNQQEMQMQVATNMRDYVRENYDELDKISEKQLQPVLRLIFQEAAGLMKWQRGFLAADGAKSLMLSPRELLLKVEGQEMKEEFKESRTVEDQ